MRDWIIASHAGAPAISGGLRGACTQVHGVLPPAAAHPCAPHTSVTSDALSLARFLAELDMERRHQLVEPGVSS